MIKMDYRQYTFYFSAQKQVLLDSRFADFGEMEILSSANSIVKSFHMHFFMDKNDSSKTISIAILGEKDDRLTLKVFIPFDRNSTESDPYYDALLADWLSAGLVTPLDAATIETDLLVKNLMLA
jgi:hypothetical protein